MFLFGKPLTGDGKVDCGLRNEVKGGHVILGGKPLGYWLGGMAGSDNEKKMKIFSINSF